jgi:bromodomain-containing factor 1
VSVRWGIRGHRDRPRWKLRRKGWSPSAARSASLTRSSSADHALQDLSLNSASFAEPVGATDVEPKYSNGVNGINAHRVESNGVPVAIDSKPVAAPIDALMSLDASITTTTATTDAVVQQPVSDVREPPKPRAHDEPRHKLNQDVARDVARVNGLGQQHVGATPIEAGSDDPMDISEPADGPAHIEHSLPRQPPVPAVDGPASDAPDLIPAPVPCANEPTVTLAVADLLPPAQDQVMLDAPPSPGKMARSRDDDDEAMDDGPAVKRVRADGDASQPPEAQPPAAPETGTLPPPETPGSNDAATAETVTVDLSDPSYRADMTPRQAKHLAKGLQNIRRIREAVSFNAPVDPVALALPDYPDRIKHPMDLGTMEANFKAGRYATVAAYLADFSLMVDNSILYNGAQHPVSQGALKLKGALERQLAKLPPRDAVDEPAAAKKAKRPSAPAAPKQKRESRASVGTSKSPTVAASPQTFALGPQGIPTIRRDSTANAGRPKREIHPPAPRDLPYSNQKPKKKKYQLELRFCREALNEMLKSKHHALSGPFAAPVDPVAMAIPSYFQVIKKPMDLSTIDSKLKQGAYENAKEFEADVRLMFNNCYKFNPKTDLVHKVGKQFEDVFDDKWAGKKAWIEEHTPVSGPQTPGSSPEPDDEDEDEDDEDEDDEDDEAVDQNQLSILQRQIAAMSKQMELITQKKKASPPVGGKKGAKGRTATKKESKKGGGATTSKTARKDGAKPTKKPAKIPYVTYEQKQDISNRINTLPEARMATALSIIRDNMPNLKVRTIV